MFRPKLTTGPDFTGRNTDSSEKWSVEVRNGVLA